MNRRHGMLLLAACREWFANARARRRFKYQAARVRERQDRRRRGAALDAWARQVSAG